MPGEAADLLCPVQESGLLAQQGTVSPATVFPVLFAQSEEAIASQELAFRVFVSIRSDRCWLWSGSLLKHHRVRARVPACGRFRPTLPG